MSVVTSPCRCTNIAIIALIKLTLTTKVSIASYINLGLAFSVGYTPFHTIVEPILHIRLTHNKINGRLS